MSPGATELGPAQEGKGGFTRRRFLAAAGWGLGLLATPRAAGAALAGLGAPPLQLAMVRAVSARDFEKLTHFDDTHRRVGDEIEVLLWPGDRARLDATGLGYRITDADVMAATSADAVADYRHLADYEAALAALVTAHPSRARLMQLPRLSREGRTVFGIEIATDVAAADGRPVFYMDGLHHAREWPSGEVAVMFAEDLLGNFDTDARIRNLLAQVRVIIVPVVNVDGFHYSREAIVGSLTPDPAGVAGYWRKSRHTFGDDVERTVPEAHIARPFDPSAYGVDLNRNYPYHWNGPGSSFNYVSETHTGPWPFEPEIANPAAVYSSRHVTTSLSNHTYSELVLRPWGDTWAKPPDESALRDLGDAMADINGYWSINSIELYPTTGTADDWAYAAYGTYAYTFELGQGFHPSYAGYIPALYARNRDAFLLCAEAAADAANHGIIRGEIDEPATITLRKTWYTPFYFSSGMEESRTASLSIGPGPFEWHVNPSTRPVVESPEAYAVEIASATGLRTFDVVVGRGQVVDLGSVAL